MAQPVWLMPNGEAIHGDRRGLVCYASRAIADGMKLATKTDITEFDPEQQDALLAEMQRQALADFESAATVAERGLATRAFADATAARSGLAESVARIRHQRLVRTAQQR